MDHEILHEVDAARRSLHEYFEDQSTPNLRLRAMEILDGICGVDPSPTEEHDDVVVYRLDLTGRFISQSGRGVNIYASDDKSMERPVLRLSPPTQWGEKWTFCQDGDAVVFTRTPF